MSDAAAADPEYTPSLKVDGKYQNPWRNFPGMPTFKKFLLYAFRVNDKDVSNIPSSTAVGH